MAKPTRVTDSRSAPHDAPAARTSVGLTGRVDDTGRTTIAIPAGTSSATPLGHAWLVAAELPVPLDDACWYPSPQEATR